MDDRAAIDDDDTARPMRNLEPLSQSWLVDQAIAFAATLLGDVDISFEARSLAATHCIIDSTDRFRAGLVSDSTLALATTIDTDFFKAETLRDYGLEKLAGCADELSDAVKVARGELSRRDGISRNRLNRMLISHAVYLLKRPHLSTLKFLKWLDRAVPTAVPGVKRIITDLQHPNSPRAEAVEAALQNVRDLKLQSRDRLDYLDEFHELVLNSAFEQRDTAYGWWTRICMAYRSSLFCWPLLAETSADTSPDISGDSERTEEQLSEKQPAGRRLRGLSLPISLFVIEDGDSTWRSGPNPRGQKIWFKYKLSRSEETFQKEPRFRAPKDGLPAHIDGFRFGFKPDWWQAFNVGLDVAKKLWNSQNGRLRFADPLVAERKLTASLNVDLRAACDIVDAVFSKVPEEEWTGQDRDTHFFTVSDRSAEAYWVQCILSLMLPSGDLPMGVCTGTVSYRDGEFELGLVKGVAAKLEYANRAGFTRVIVPGDARDYFEDDPFSEDEVVDAPDQPAGPVELLSEPEETAASENRLDDNAKSKVLADQRRFKLDIKTFLEHAGAGNSEAANIVLEELEGAIHSEDLPENVKIWREFICFLLRLQVADTRKTIEVNFARSARAAADAMQPAGWRRTDFLRTPKFQRMFGRNQRRLFIRDALRDRKFARRLRPSDVAAYRRNEWSDVEEQRIERLDRQLQSRTGRAVVHVTRESIRKAIPGMSVDEALGAWAAWKDNEVRRGTMTGYRGPGLGVVTLRSAEGDTETRIWAALAEMLVADEGWWARFQWADLPEAADLLAQLLCNHQADPKICQASAPDLLIVFDDRGFATERSNQIFPTEFHHQFIDLLNPRLPTNNKFDYLDEALKRYSQNDRGLETRVIVVLREDTPNAPMPALDEIELPHTERMVLERLALFRFGCNRHAGFAMANFETSDEDRLDWPKYEKVLLELKRRSLLGISRSIIYLTPKGRQMVGAGMLVGEPFRLAKAHRHAALALCPILSPSGARISTNRDRQLEPESLLEANWHLKQAFDLVPWRFRTFWNSRDGLPSVPEAQAQLTFLRTMPDWDTVKRLRVNSATRQDSIQLSLELLKSQEDILQHQPPSLVVGLAIETMGRVFRNEAQRESTIEEKVNEIVSLVDAAIEGLKDERLSPTEWRRRLRHLLSRQLFALRMLGLPLNDPILVPARTYIDNSVLEILEPNFLEIIGPDRDGLDDFPISLDCWRMLWSDGHRDATPNKTLSLTERSRYAYAAARANLEKTRSDGSKRESWDEPWIAYFTQTRPEDIEPKQITAPLKTWWSVYGDSEDASREFGRRVLDMQSHALKTKRGAWEERWLSDLGTASGNLWRYVTSNEKTTRLVGPPVAPALRLIRVLALSELLPAWLFLQNSLTKWLESWPVLACSPPGAHWPFPAARTYGFVADEWTQLARAIVGHKAGWVAMLASLKQLPNNNARLALLRSWLSACRAADITKLSGQDPENLERLSYHLPTSKDFSLHRFFAQKNADHVLNLARGGEYLLQDPPERDLLTDFVDQILGSEAVFADEATERAGNPHDAPD